MGKILIGFLSGIFIGAVIYELLNRTNPELMNKINDLVSPDDDSWSDRLPKTNR